MGNVGGVTSKLLNNEGCRIVAVSDVSGGVYCKTGLNIEEILKFISQNCSYLKDYETAGVSHITNEEVLTCEADVLVPAVLENQITEKIAPNIKTSVIVEGANGPTTLEADRILERNGKKIVLDILANAGGVVVSYFEWVQNTQTIQICGFM